MTENPDRQYIEDAPQEVQDLLYVGRKIQAIKLVRERMGLGLKEAKDRVDELEARLRERFPDAMPRAERRSGCGSAVVLLLALIAVVTVVLARSWLES
jgi:hypothetical protein